MVRFCMKVEIYPPNVGRESILQSISGGPAEGLNIEDIVYLDKGCSEHKFYLLKDWKVYLVGVGAIWEGHEKAELEFSLL